MTNTNNTNPLLALLLGALPLLAGSCDTEEALMPDDYANTDDDAAGEGDELRSWTGYTSEENPPLICANQYAAAGFDCWGSYCDNVALDCRYVSGSSAGQSVWTSYFSEEGSGTTDEGHCEGTDRWMTGVACTGKYCDNLSLRCTKFSGSWTGGCYWSGLFSEEQPPFYAPSGYFIKGMECDGSYCDNKRYRYCWMN